jgi:hypothetical protein
VPQQAFLLGQLPTTRSVSFRRGMLRWEGDFQPTAQSDRYLVRIEYKAPVSPVLTVLSPQLQRPERGVLPHVYDDDHLCVCYPRQWSAEKRIDQTIVPWIVEWLFYYELWTFTGEWYGGGHGTPSAKDRSAEDPGDMRAA